VRTAIYDWFLRHPLPVDLAIVGALLLFTFVSGSAGRGLREVVVGLALVLPLAVRRLWPVVSFSLVVVGGLLQLFLLAAPIAADIAVLCALYALAAHERRSAVRWVGLAIGVFAAVLAATDWVAPGQLRRQGAVSFLVLLFLVLVSWVLGDLMRSRRAVVSRLQEQNAALARERDQRARLAAQEERSRIAREMHDVVAHSLSVIVVQADGGAYAARNSRQDPRTSVVRASATLDTIGDTARRALAETRRLVGVLRQEDQHLELAPQAGLDGLEPLVEQMRASGLRVTHRVTGPVDSVPRDVDLAAYRVVQESLTNVLKHAGPTATAEVLVGRHRGVLEVRVIDDGRGASAADDGAGNGLLGMSERVAVYGGRLEAGPRTGGGFAVNARIPLQENVHD
jgi:signal transduction histidine kinase